MDSIEPKKILTLRILQILVECSDEKHPLKQDAIIEELKNYGLACERKTVGRTIKLLRDSGFQIGEIRNVGAKKGGAKPAADEESKKVGEGYYFDGRMFQDYEIQTLIDTVRASKYIKDSYADSIVENLCKLAGPSFKPALGNDDIRKRKDQQNVLYNVMQMRSAIDKNEQVRFDYNYYGADKKLHKYAEFTVSPYKFEVKNQKYYLVAKNEDVNEIYNFRIDRITDPVPVKGSHRTKIDAAANFADYEKYKTRAVRPYMFGDAPQSVTFRCSPKIVDQMVDNFGLNFSVFETGEESVQITVLTSRMAMKYLALQYLGSIEVLYPSDLREEIKETVAEALAKYQRPL